MQKLKLKNIISQKGIDVVVDTTGIKEIRELAYEVTSSEGRTILVGVPKKGVKMEIDSFPLHFNKILTGSFGGDINPSYEIPRLIRLQKVARLNLDGLITHVYKLREINEAIRILKKGEAIRCVIDMSK